MLLVGLTMAAIPWLVVELVESAWWPDDWQESVWKMQDFARSADIALAVVFFLGGGIATAAVTRLFWRWSRR